MPLRLRVISDNRVLLGDERSMEFVGCGGTLGRNLDNDWVLPDPNRYISARHALIDFQVGAYYIVDLSRNGVYINGSDTPVGRGHPQRLFDGDQLRLGDFEITVEITPGDDHLADDGMRDSVVRAQLVPEDDSVEHALVDANRLVEDDVLARHLSTESSGRASQIKPRVPDTPTPTQHGKAPVNNAGAAVAIMLNAAGLKPKDLAGAMPAEVMQTTGKLLRVLVSGIIELLHDRAQLKDTFRLAQTIIKPERNNPLKFSPGVNDALQYLLSDRSDSYLSAEEAVRSALQDIKSHEQAVVTAMLQALDDFMDRFDPDELRAQYDQGLSRNALLAGANKRKYWELYEESYQVLTHHEEGTLPEAFSEEFARAYEQQVQHLKASRRN